jgi:hypothetical protein
MKIIIITYALLIFFPHLDDITAKRYARSIYEESEVYNVKVSTIVARTYVESGFHNIVSKKFACRIRTVNRKKVKYCRQSFGLMQPEITPRTNPEYIGKEHKFMIPEINFHIGTKTLAYWKRWHKYNRCKHKPKHPYWLHYKYGYVIPPKKRIRPKGGWKVTNFQRNWNRTIRTITHGLK